MRPSRPRLGAADGLSLLAAPTFAVMALLTAVGGGPLDAFCSVASPPSSSMGGMVPMYLLMSVFHLSPWLRLMRRRPQRKLCNGPGLPHQAAQDVL